MKQICQIQIFLSTFTEEKTTFQEEEEMTLPTAMWLQSTTHKHHFLLSWTLF